MTATVRLDTRKLDSIAANLKPKRDKIIVDTAFRIEDKAKRTSPFELGALRSSGYVKTSESSGYADGVAAAQGLRPDAQIAPEPQLEKPYNAIVGFSVEYALFQELGTEVMAAQPFLVPALESERADYDKKMKELVK